MIIIMKYLLVVCIVFFHSVVFASDNCMYLMWHEFHEIFIGWVITRWNFVFYYFRIIYHSISYQTSHFSTEKLSFSEENFLYKPCVWMLYSHWHKDPLSLTKILCMMSFRPHKNTYILWWFRQSGYFNFYLVRNTSKEWVFCNGVCTVYS